MTKWPVQKLTQGTTQKLLQHTKFELNRCSLLKVIERTHKFDNGRTDGRTRRRTHEHTHARTGVIRNAPPPFVQ